MRYLILGDVHGNWPSMTDVIHNVVNRSIPFDEIIQVGDFGYYPRIINQIFQYKNEIKVPIHFIDGNHEDHSFLLQTYKKLLTHGIFYHPRGEITILPDGTKIGWMGGAFNVDRPQEFWPDGAQNFPTKLEINKFITKVNNTGGVDLMITHSCPHSIGVGIPGHPAFVPGVEMFINKLGYASGPIEDCGDLPLTELWNGLTCKPITWVFGHFHLNTKSKVGNTNFWCVGTSDNRYGQQPIYIYDSATKSVLT